jgi:hypothetical protein
MVDRSINKDTTYRSYLGKPLPCVPEVEEPKIEARDDTPKHHKREADDPQSAYLKEIELYDLFAEVADLYRPQDDEPTSDDKKLPYRREKISKEPLRLPLPGPPPPARQSRPSTPITSDILELIDGYTGIMPPGGRIVKAGDATPAPLTVKNAQGKAKKLDQFSDPDKLFGQKSKLANANLEVPKPLRVIKSPATNKKFQNYFSNHEAWDVLKDEEIEHIKELLPENTPYDSDGRPSAQFLRYNSDWRNSLRLFQNDLTHGHYEKDWKESAAQAMEERARGDFDQWKESQYEQFWGQKQKVGMVIAGEMAKIKLPELIEDGNFRVNDIWSYARAFRKSNGTALIEKEVKVRSFIDTVYLKT